MPYDLSHMLNIKNKKYEQTKQKQTRGYREQSSGYQRGSGGQVIWVKKVNCIVTDGN